MCDVPRLVLYKTDITMLNRTHLSKLIAEQAQRYGEKTVMSYRDYELSRWIPVTWGQFDEKVQLVGRALLALKVGVQENIAVFSQNKPECLFVDFGAYAVRAVTVPFYPTSSSSQITYMLNDAAIRILFVGEQQQYDVAYEALSLSNTLERIVIFDEKVVRKESDHLSMYFDEFVAMGATVAYEDEWQHRQDSVRDEDLANILYTSGTTGRSKGVMITHAMYREGIRVNDSVLPLSERDVFLTFLPLTHIFERAWTYLGLAEGVELAINLRPIDVLQSMQEVRPTCMSSVPRLWEKIYQAVQEKIAAAPFLQRKLMAEALATGELAWRKYLSQRKPLPLGLSLKLKAFDKTIYRLLRKTLGLDRANIFPTAGAAVSPTVECFVHAVGINMVVGYGLTESTATVSCDHEDKPATLGSVGRLIDGLEIRFGENDEILLRGKTITPGYYKMPSTTAESLDSEGWFHTGDAGYLKDGELFLTARIKELFKTSNGKYIAPQAIETKLTIDRYFDQIIVIADERKFVSALIVPNYLLLEAYAKEKGIVFHSREELCRNLQIIKMLMGRIDLLQQDLANYERVKRITLLPEPLSMEKGELTNTLKVKRSVVNERYASVIDKMYAEAEQDYRQ